MNRALVLVVLVGCGSQARGPGGAQTRDVDEHASCVAREQVAKRRAVIDAERERALVGALASAGLTPVDLPIAWTREEGEHREDTAPDPARGFFPAWHQVRYEHADWITGSSEHVDCGVGHGADDVRFARSADGAIHHVVISPHATREERIVQCGCPDLGGMCGAYMPARVQPRWKLPDGARYAGEVRIDVAAPVLHVAASDSDPQRCALPP